MNMHSQVTDQARRVRRRNGPARALNLALQGLGAHGAFGWGILDKLLDDGRVEIPGITATSSGAINAVLYAQGMLNGGKEEARAELESFWLWASKAAAWSVPVPRTPLGSLTCGSAATWLESAVRILGPYELNPFNLNPIRNFLITHVDFGRLRRSHKIHIAVCATNVKSGHPRTFSNRDLGLDAVLAAACQPALSQAVEIDGEYYWDGAFSGLPALAPFIANSSSRDVLIGQISPIEQRHLPRRAADIQHRTSEIAVHSSLLREARALAAVTQLIDDDWIKPEHASKLSRILVHAIRSDEIMSDLSLASKYDTSWTSLTRLRDVGRLAAELWLETHFDKIGVRSTIDLCESRM